MKAKNSNYLNNLYNLKGKVVLVTGACGQVGRALTDGFLSMGSTVVGVDKDIPPAQRRKGAHYFEMDVVNKNSIKKAFDEIYKKQKRVDVLINNAGVTTFEPFLERTEEAFDLVTAVNLRGVFFCIQEFAHRTKSPGTIINIGSIYGIVSPDPRIYTDCGRNSPEVYGAVKAGVIQMTRYFAVHLASKKIRVNCVSPGGIFNPQAPQGADFVKNYSHRNPMGRMARAEEVVGAALYLASDAASYTNGHNLVVDGGMSSW